MTEPLAVWREKLAGVTPLIAEARDEAPIYRGSRVVSTRWAGETITKLADALERSDRLSRAVADEASVERLGEALYVDYWQRAGVDRATPFADHAQVIRQMWLWIACSVLNHLAQLAVGDG